MSNNQFDNTTCTDMNAWISQTRVDYSQFWSVRIIFGAIYILIFIFGILLNFGVIYSIRGRERHSQNIFLTNLMISDLLLCLTCVPIVPITNVVKEWLFGTIMCHLLPLCQSVAVMVTVWSLAAIALDRYTHIVDHTREPLHMHWAYGITALIWLLSVIINILFVYSMHLIDGDLLGQGFCGSYCMELWEERFESGPWLKVMYGTLITVISFLLPSLIICFCYWRIFKIVRETMIGGHHRMTCSLSADQRRLAIKRKRRVNYILIAVVVTFVLSWLPMTLKNLLTDYKVPISVLKDSPFLLTFITHSIAMASIVWNPLFVYWLACKGGGADKARPTTTTKHQYTTNATAREPAKTKHKTLDKNGSLNETPCLKPERAALLIEHTAVLNQATAHDRTETETKFMITDNHTDGDTTMYKNDVADTMLYNRVDHV